MSNTTVPGATAALGDAGRKQKHPASSSKAEGKKRIFKRQIQPGHGYGKKRGQREPDNYDDYTPESILCPGCPHKRNREKKGQGKYKWSCYTCSKSRSNPYLQGWGMNRKDVPLSKKRKAMLIAQEKSSSGGGAGTPKAEFVCNYCEFDDAGLKVVRAHEQVCTKNPAVNPALNVKKELKAPVKHSRGTRAASKFKKDPTAAKKKRGSYKPKTTTTATVAMATTTTTPKTAAGQTKKATASAATSNLKASQHHALSKGHAGAGAGAGAGESAAVFLAAGAVAASPTRARKKKAKTSSASSRTKSKAKPRDGSSSSSRNNSSNSSSTMLGGSSKSSSSNVTTDSGLLMCMYNDGSHMRIGDKVNAYWHDNGMFFPGTIDSTNPDGSLAITYDDGGIESAIPSANLAKQPEGTPMGAHAAMGSIENTPRHPSYDLLSRTAGGGNTLTSPERLLSGFDARVDGNATAEKLSVALVPHKLTRTMDGNTDTLYCRSARKALEFLQIKHDSQLEQSIGRGGPPIKGWKVTRCTQVEFLSAA